MELLTIDEVAETTKISSWTVREWCRQGEIKAQKVGAGAGGRWRITQKALDEFVNRNHNEAV